MKLKEFGKLTEDQFVRLIRKVPEIRATQGQLSEALRSASKGKLKEFVGDGRWWSWVYEMSFAEHIALVIVALGETEWLKKLATQEDPQENVLRYLESSNVVDEWKPEVAEHFTIADVVYLVATMQRTVLSVMLFKCSLSALLEQVRAGSTEALFTVRLGVHGRKQLFGIWRLSRI